MPEKQTTQSKSGKKTYTDISPKKTYRWLTNTWKDAQHSSLLGSVQFIFCHILLFVTPWTAAHQATLSITNPESSLKLMSIESVIPFSHLIHSLSSPSPPSPNHSLLEKCKSKLQWDITLHVSEWPSSKSQQTINAGEGVEKRERSCTVGGNVNWYSHYGRQFGDSLTN